MRALLSYESFAGFAGTETYILTVARELERRGHEASVYTPNPGPIADQAREQGLRIIGRGELPADCDVLLCSDAATCYELMELVGCPVRMFIAHSVDYALQYAPQLRQAGGAVVVMNDRVGRWVKSQARHPPVARLRQPIDLGRFLDLGAPRARARRVLVSSNYLDGARVQLIERACRACGLELDSIGAKSRMTSTPERALAEADIVIGLGRTALEAMAAGRAVYVYGQVGADGWVTPESYPRMEADGFAGMATGKALDGETLAAELRAWSPEMGEANRDLACAHHGARAHVTELLELAQRIGSDGDCAAAAVPDGWALAHELARLVRLEWQARTRAATAVREASHFRAERERLEAELVSAGELERQLELSQGRVIDAERRLAEHLATRRWRLACRIAEPVDRLRAWRGDH